MVYIVQLIYIREGQEAVLDQFESIAIPAILRYNGRLLFRLRPEKDAYLEAHMEKPYEIHLVEFETENDFTGFLQDAERKQFLHLKEQSIQSSVLIKGSQL